MKACNNKRKLNRLLTLLLSMITLVVVMLPSAVFASNVVISKEPPKTAEISLNKTSKLPECTEGNENYTLQGAEYTVYKDEGCTKMVGKITTDDAGKGKISGLPLGQYWVKETKASEGYAKDTQVYYCDLRSGTDSVIKGNVESKETPLLDPVTLVIKKTGNIKPDAIKGQSLADAHFEFKFYENKPSTVDPATQGKTPKWSWVLKTDKDGFSALSEEYKVSGPDIPKNQHGAASLPYGTVTIKEVKAPEGFAINSKVFVVPIENKGSNIGPVYQEPTIEDKSVSIDLVKYQIGEDGKKYVVPDAEFKHTFPNGTTEIAKTDSNGNISFKGLTYGDHVVEEVKVPDGFAVNKNKITFTVSKDNKIKITSSHKVTDTDGQVTVSVGEDGNIDGTVENKPAPFKLNIHKINNKDFSLKDAEFTLYSDSNCSQKVTSGISDASGNITMNGLIVGKEYYLKETKAPRGYKIPVNADGSEIIWKIKTTSYPTQGKFTFYVNDKPYTSDNGQFHISGTPADRIVNMEIINSVGANLPNTGSGKMLVLVTLGVLLVGISIVISNRKSYEN